MKRVGAAALAIAAALASAGPAAATTQLTAQISSGAQLPYRAVVVGLPVETALTDANVHVFENGAPVTGVSVVPASRASNQQFGVVLVIDASDSMRGAPESGAVAAARELVANVTGSSQVALVTFNQSPRVVLPLTKDTSAIQSALATQPQLASGTHIYDATKTAIGLLQAAHIRSGSVVVLSDGADTGSGANASGVSSLARAAHVTVYTVGLRSKVFDSQALTTLAESTGGRFSEASSPAELAAIYGGLGQELANQYLVRYRTSQPAGTNVKVAVKVDGIGVATTSYATPAGAPGAAFHRSLWGQFWRSPLGMVFATLVSALLVGVAAGVLVRPRASGLRGRVGQFVAVDSAKDARSKDTLLTAKLYAGAEKSLGNSGFWTRFKGGLQLAEISVEPGQIVFGTLLGGIVVGWLAASITGFPIMWLFGLVVVLVPRALIQSKLRRRRTAFAEQLPDNLQVMASAMRAGHSFIGALSVVVEDCAEPSATEFRRVIADEQLGESLESALTKVADRMKNRDLRQVALVAALQRETGGNTAEVLERVTDTIRERFELRRLVKTLTAQGRMSRWVVSALPLFLLAIITLINPKYMQPLFDRPLGRVLLIGAAVFVVLGSMVIKRIVDIKV